MLIVLCSVDVFLVVFSGRGVGSVSQNVFCVSSRYVGWLDVVEPGGSLIKQGEDTHRDLMFERAIGPHSAIVRSQQERRL